MSRGHTGLLAPQLVLGELVDLGQVTQLLSLLVDVPDLQIDVPVHGLVDDGHGLVRAIPAGDGVPKGTHRHRHRRSDLPSGPAVPPELPLVDAGPLELPALGVDLAEDAAELLLLALLELLHVLGAFLLQPDALAGQVAHVVGQVLFDIHEVVVDEPDAALLVFEILQRGLVAGLLFEERVQGALNAQQLLHVLSLETWVLLGALDQQWQFLSPASEPLQHLPRHSTALGFAQLGGRGARDVLGGVARQPLTAGIPHPRRPPQGPEATLPIDRRGRGLVAVGVGLGTAQPDVLPGDGLLLGLRCRVRRLLVCRQLHLRNRGFLLPHARDRGGRSTGPRRRSETAQVARRGGGMGPLWRRTRGGRLEETGRRRRQAGHLVRVGGLHRWPLNRHDAVRHLLGDHRSGLSLLEVDLLHRQVARGGLRDLGQPDPVLLLEGDAPVVVLAVALEGHHMYLGSPPEAT